MADQTPLILTTEDFIGILARFAKLVSDNTKELCRLDSIVGDGDHGTTINRGTMAAQDKIETSPPENIGALLSVYAMTLLSSMGGASGPIFTSIFQGMHLAAKDRTQVEKQDIVNMFEQALEKTTTLGKAEEGEKTLIDSMAPAVRAARSELENDSELSKILSSAYQASLDGVCNTRNMVAKKGRARYAGERSLGHEDAGSVTISLLFRAFSEYLNTGGSHA